MGRLKNLYKRYIQGVSPEELDLEELKARGLKVGKETYLYSVGTIDHIYPHLISIGDDVMISTNVTILAHDASPCVVKCGTKVGRVIIGNNVFIGTGCTILCDTKIGNDVIIGAGSLVTSDLPDGGVYAGMPARRICSIEEYREKYEKLRKERPDFSKIMPWSQWYHAGEAERQQMIDGLEDGFGFI